MDVHLIRQGIAFRVTTSFAQRLQITEGCGAAFTLGVDVVDVQCAALLALVLVTSETSAIVKLFYASSQATRHSTVAVSFDWDGEAFLKVQLIKRHFISVPRSDSRSAAFTGK